MTRSLFKLSTLLGAATAATPNSAQDSALGQSVEGTPTLSQDLSQLGLEEHAESSQESFEHIVYEDSDELSNWCVPSSVPVTPTLSSPTLSLPVSSAQEGDGLLLLPLLHQQQQRDVELDQEEQQDEQQEEKQDFENEQQVEQLDHQELQREHPEQQLYLQLRSDSEELDEEQEHQLQLHHNQQQFYELRLPLDVWIKICSKLYPSQLARFSLVNKGLYDLVASLHVWEGWHKRLHGEIWYADNISREARYNMRVLPGLPRSHSYMLFMCAISRQVCEKCLRRCDGKLQRGRLASMPLPVVVHQGPVKDELESFEDDEERLWTIRMCKRCRISHYQSHLEPIPQEITTSFLTKRVIREKYHLGHKEVQAITIRGGKRGMITYSEAAALMESRRVFGGEVGRLAVPKSFCKFMKPLDHRLYIYDARRRVLEAGMH